MLIVLGFMVFGALLIYLYLEHDKAESARKLAHAKSLMAKNQIDIIDIIDPRVSFSSYDGSPERIIGRLRNNSNYTVRSVELYLQFEDCAANRACETVGDANENVLVNVPPGQSRDFHSSIYGNRISAKGTRRWNYSINSITTLHRQRCATWSPGANPVQFFNSALKKLGPRTAFVAHQIVPLLRSQFEHMKTRSSVASGPPDARQMAAADFYSEGDEVQSVDF